MSKGHLTDLVVNAHLAEQTQIFINKLSNFKIRITLLEYQVYRRILHQQVTEHFLNKVRDIFEDVVSEFAEVEKGEEKERRKEQRSCIEFERLEQAIIQAEQSSCQNSLKTSSETVTGEEETIPEWCKTPQIRNKPWGSRWNFRSTGYPRAPNGYRASDRHNHPSGTQ
jgi:hypothetical protein